MKYKRSSGILLHPTSLPGPDGIGDMGPEAYRWVGHLAKTGCTYWQILPLGPTGYGDSPYQCFSAFAGNPYLISPALLMEDDLISRDDLLNRPNFEDHTVDFGNVIPWKLFILDKAYRVFKKQSFQKLKREFVEFTETQRYWLDDFATFMAIKDAQNGNPWNVWDEPLKNRDPHSLTDFQNSHKDSIESHAFRQFLFYRQWASLKAFCCEKNIEIIGDIPIFVSLDSADAWGHPELFYFNTNGQPTVVAGVPPDYFSPTGQLWGNPLYRWNVHRETGYAWWIQRIRAALEQVDVIRLDHFRGFYNYWKVPAKNTTAEIGKWVKGPGGSIFHAIRQSLGELPIIAEDLGGLIPEVYALRDQLGFPGMKVFQFAFDEDADHPFLPHNYPENCVAYTGTHDNDTVRGWYHTAPEKEKDFCRRYLARSGDDISWDMIRGIWSSVASIAIAPAQDFSNLGGEARMNFPGRLGGNWSWRMQADDFTPFVISRIQETNQLYGRINQALTRIS